MSLLSFLLDWTNLGIQRRDLVLEVGSGGRPFARSDVLCDMFMADSSERVVAPLVTDRPFVCANAELLPFADKAFDFVISFHVVEHLLHPERFLAEAGRVAQRGYFVTPSELCERILPCAKHLWMISVEADGTLLLKQKTRANESGVPPLLHDAWLRDRRFRRFFHSRPDLFETRFRWEDEFCYEISRADRPPAWLNKASLVPGGPHLGGPATCSAAEPPLKHRFRTKVRAALSWLIRRWHSRSTAVELDPLLVCPVCKGQLNSGQSTLTCAECRRVYPVRDDGIPILLPDAARKGARH